MTRRQAMILLREDALRRDLPELAIVYGWSAIDSGLTELIERAKQLAACQKR